MNSADPHRCPDAVAGALQALNDLWETWSRRTPRGALSGTRRRVVVEDLVLDDGPVEAADRGEASFRSHRRVLGLHLRLLLPHDAGADDEGLVPAGAAKGEPPLQLQAVGERGVRLEREQPPLDEHLEHLAEVGLGQLPPTAPRPARPGAPPRSRRGPAVLGGCSAEPVDVVTSAACMAPSRSPATVVVEGVGGRLLGARPLLPAASTRHSAQRRDGSDGAGQRVAHNLTWASRCVERKPHGGGVTFGAAQLVIARAA